MSATAIPLSQLPPSLAEIAAELTSATVRERLQLLLEYADELPPLPEPYASEPDRLEQVHECQSPLFLAVAITDGRVRVFFDAPDEAPTTRGFAGILHAALDGLTPDEVLAVPDDAPMRLGLTEAVSPLRIRGMGAMLSRVKRQVRARLAV